MKLQNPNIKCQMNDKGPINEMEIFGFWYLKFNWHLAFDICHYRGFFGLLSSIAGRTK